MKLYAKNLTEPIKKSPYILRRPLQLYPMAEMTQLTAQLSPQQTIYLSCNGTSTTISVISAQAGQQQQSASQVTTGGWVAPPQLFQMAQSYVGQSYVEQSYVGKLLGEQAQHTFYIQGTQIQVSSGGYSEAIATQLKTATSIPLHPTNNAPSSPPSMDPMQPMEPMQPMSMGSMSMSPLSSSPITMRMGDMSMSMGMSSETVSNKQKGREQKREQEIGEHKQSTTAKTKRFCSQCGEAVNAGDRFCAYCGHQLS